jgi:hypothetical protein
MTAPKAEPMEIPMLEAMGLSADARAIDWGYDLSAIFKK